MQYIQWSSERERERERSIISFENKEWLHQFEWQITDQKVINLLLVKYIAVLQEHLFTTHRTHKHK